jgi:hypothetical protein
MYPFSMRHAFLLVFVLLLVSPTQAQVSAPSEAEARAVLAEWLAAQAASHPGTNGLPEILPPHSCGCLMKPLLGW